MCLISPNFGPKKFESVGSVKDSSTQKLSLKRNFLLIAFAEMMIRIGTLKYLINLKDFDSEISKFSPERFFKILPERKTLIPKPETNISPLLWDFKNEKIPP